MDGLSTKGTTGEASAPVPASTPEVLEESKSAPSTGSGDSFESMFPEPAIAISGPPSWIWWVVLIIASTVLALLGYTMAQDTIK